MWGGNGWEQEEPISLDKTYTCSRMPWLDEVAKLQEVMLQNALLEALCLRSYSGLMLEMLENASLEALKADVLAWSCLKMSSGNLLDFHSVLGLEVIEYKPYSCSKESLCS